jgi:GMP reductase
MNIDHEVKLDFCDVLIRPKRSSAASRSEVSLDRHYKFRNAQLDYPVICGIPVIASNMDTIGTLRMAHEMTDYGMWCCLHKYHTPEEIRDNIPHMSGWRCFYSMGVTEDDFSKLLEVKKMIPLPHICLDVANGYTQFFQDRVKRVRDMFPEAVIMAGNVATPEMVAELLLSGAADIVKVGIGPGVVCKTRIVTGVGYPQLSAIIECADAAHGLGGHICADGGCSTPGDVAKAFAAGADFVMIGGMLAGCDECDGEWEYENGQKKSLKFYGMSSEEAMNKHSGGMASYRASEGRCTQVPARGRVRKVLQEIEGGLRSACTYVGAMRLKDLSKCTTFVRVNRVHSQDT